MLLSSILTARFALPQGVDCDGQGGAIVADTYNQAVRHVGPGGITVTLAGGERNGNVDGSGTAAEFSEPVRAACRTTLRELGPCSHTQVALPPAPSTAVTPRLQVGIFYHTGERSAYVVEQGNRGLRRVSVGDLEFKLATSAAPAGTAPGSTMGAVVLAGAAAAWLAYRGTVKGA